MSYFKRIKWIILLPLCLPLAGCFWTNTDTKTVYKNQYPPDYLLKECYPEKPDEATIGDVIQLQSAALHQCNNQLSALRFWKSQSAQENNNENEEEQE